MSLSTTSVNFNTPPHRDCNFDARLVSKTRKYHQSNMSEIREGNLRSPTQVPHTKKGDTFTSSQSVQIPVQQIQCVNSVKYLSFNPSRVSKRPAAHVQTHPSPEKPHVPALSTAPSSRCRGLTKESPKCDQSVFPGFPRLLVAHCLLLFFSLPSWSIWSFHREKCSTLPPFQWLLSAFAPVLMFTTNYDSCLFCTSDGGSIQQMCDPVKSWSGVWDPWSVEYQSCKLAMLL